MEIPTTKPPDRPKTTSSSSLICPTCQASFKRPEHLKRHLRSHTKEKPFQCHQCSRRFSRSDTLHRHDQSHHAPGAQGKLDYAHRITVKTFRACYQCATARVRCSGGDPCARCQSRTIGCQYPTERRSKLKKANRVRRTSAEEDRAHVRKSPEQRTPTSGNVDTALPTIRSSGSPRAQAPQQTRFQFVHHGDVYQQSVMDQHNFTATQPTLLTTERPPGMSVLSQQHSVEQSSNPSSMSYPYSNHESQRMLQNDHSPLFTVADSISMPRDTRPNDLQAQESHMPITEQSMDMILDPHLSDINSSSALNWISTGLLKDHGDSLPIDTDLLNHSVEQWWPESFDTSITWLSPLDGFDPMPLNNYFRQNVTGSAPSVGSPERYSSLSPDGSLLSSPVDDSVLSGEYYVDGDGPRCARNSRKRKKEFHKVTEDIISSLQVYGSPREDSSFSFPETHHIRTDDSDLTAVLDRQISPAMYEEITSFFEKLCRLESLIFTPFSTDHFPSSDTLAYFLRQYLDGFQPVYPIFHVPTFELNETHWILVLAISAMGSNFANIPNMAQPLHEFVRRAIVVETQRSTADHTPLWLMQAMLLNSIGLLYSGIPQSKNYGLAMFGELVHLAKRQGLFSANHISQETRRWRAWIENETQRRTGYLIWLVDTTLAYTTDHQPLLALKDIQTSLPVHESLWEADSEQTWQALYKEENASLCSAMEILFIEKRLIPGIGEFSHILLLHALYHRLWEVGDYFQRPLSWWTPTAEKRTRESALPSKSVWLPGIPLFSKWRNSVCDCLDTLHWSANATIAKAAGIEHPTVLHLHTARLVLLVPFHEIRQLARSLSRQEASWDTLDQTAEWRHIWRWTKHDQYKARLSIIHAGSIIWYMRRYSTNAFHEPIAVFLATLTIWAYGLCNQSQTQSEPSGSAHEVLTSTANPTFIHVDRPCDDEIVQLFVRVGQSMRANISGVGDICSPHGPTRILQEGVRILSSLVLSWGAALEYIDILSRMGHQPSLATPTAIGEW